MESVVVESAPPGYYYDEAGEIKKDNSKNSRVFVAAGIALCLLCVTLGLIFGLLNEPAKCEAVTRADIVFILDESGSIEQSDYLALLRNISAFVKRLPLGPDKIRLGVIEFSNYTNNTANGNNVINLYEYDDPVLLQRRIESLGHSGGYTELGAALRFIRDKYFGNALNRRPDAELIFIYIGDGFYTDDSPDDEIEDIKAIPTLGPLRFVFLPIVGTDGSFSSLLDPSFERDPERFFKAPQNNYEGVSRYLLNDFQICQLQI